MSPDPVPRPRGAHVPRAGPTRPRTLLLLLALALPARAGTDDLGAVRRLARDPLPRTRAAAYRRLAGRDDVAALRLLVEGLDDEHPYVRRAVAGVLGATDGPAHARLGHDLARLSSARARAAGLRAAALWTDRVGLDLLLLLARDRMPMVRAAAVRWLGQTDDPAAVPPIRDALEDHDGLVRAVAIDVLAARTGADPPSVAFFADPDFRVRLSALEGSVAPASPTGGGRAAVVAVLHGLDDAVWSVRLRAAELAGVVRDRQVLAPLVARLGDERLRVRAAAHASLVRLTSIPFDPDPAAWTAWLEGDGRDFDPAGAPASRAPHALPDDERTVAGVRFLDLPLASRHVGFVLDGSGSMARPGSDGRPRWARVVEALDQAIARLGSARVNVYCFSDDVEALFPHAVELGAANRKRIHERLDGRAPHGRTALYDGIAAALDDPDLDTVVVLSDGVPSAGAWFTRTDLFEEVLTANRWRRARIDVLDVGGDDVAARWQETLRRLAARTGGTYLRR